MMVYETILLVPGGSTAATTVEVVSTASGVLEDSPFGRPGDSIMVSNGRTVMKRTYNRLGKMPMEGAGAKEQDRSRDGAGQDSVVNSSARPLPTPWGLAMKMTESRKDLMPQEGMKLKAENFAYVLTNCCTSTCLLVWPRKYRILLWGGGGCEGQLY